MVGRTEWQPTRASVLMAGLQPVRTAGFGPGEQVQGESDKRRVLTDSADRQFQECRSGEGLEVIRGFVQWDTAPPSSDGDVTNRWSSRLEGRL